MGERFDVVVIGGGGTGSEVAYELARKSDRRVALIERDKLGGECTHYGCVPTKVMLRSAKLAAQARDAQRFGLEIPDVRVDLPAIQRRAHEVIDEQSGGGAAPFERVGARVFLQEGRLTGDRRVELADGTTLEADAVVLTTGTEPAVPPIPGLADGPYWTNREAIWGPTEPPPSLAVIGTGAIGVEFAQLYGRLGSEVTALEAMPQLLPLEDEEAANSVRAALEAEGIRVRTGVRITGARHDGADWTVELEDGDHVHVRELLVAAGRRPVFDVHDLDAAGVALDDRARPVLTDTLRTTNPRVWAAGDATGELLFTHVGTYEAQLVVDDLLGRPRPRDYRAVPRVTFCDPEVASVGMTERAARAEGHDVVTVSYPMAANERAHIDGSTEGVVKLVAERSTGELLGAHLVSEEAGAMLHELVTIMAVRATADAVARTIHAYPTRSEAVQAALLGVAEQVG
jgi:pyruvate/2-oxoglutarate dehydrogenase complex dihydrolipoamide dehydrogenase (E3) component